MKIPFVDLKHRYIEEKEELNSIINDVLSSGNLILSKEVTDLEETISKFLGVKYCLTLNSGTDALMMALWALGITKGDEVITSTVSFIATAGSIAHVGATPIFVNCTKDLNINVDEIEKKITKNTKAIMPVHWTGRMSDIIRVKEISEKYGIPIIEDAAQAIGSSINGVKPGHLSDFACFSSHPLKPLNGLGDSGYLVTNNSEMYQKIKLYRNHGLVERDNAEIFGVNSRMDSINAAIIRMRLDKLESVIERRKKNINFYRENIKTDKFYIIPDKENETNTFAMFVCLAEERDKLKKFLYENGVESLVYYGNPLHKHSASAKLNLDFDNLEYSEKICGSVLSIPFHQYLNHSEIEYISDLINKFYK